MNPSNNDSTNGQSHVDATSFPNNIAGRRSMSNETSMAIDMQSNDNVSIPSTQLSNDFANLIKETANYNVCSVCHEIDILSSFKIDPRSLICSRCSRQRSFKKFSAENGMIPDQVPPELKDLSFLEEMLISKQLAHMYISRLRTGGQFGYRNHVVAFPQDVNTFTRELPRRVTDAGILIVRKPGLQNTHRDYVVRRDAVMNALIWLKQNNPYYTDIVISDENLASLPIHAVPSDLPTEVLPSSHTDTGYENLPEQDNLNAGECET